MAKKEQTTTRRYEGGKWITETEGRDLDPEGNVAVEAATARARKAMTTGAKPKVSEDEPEKGTIAHIAWKRRQKNRTAAEGAAALASR